MAVGRAEASDQVALLEEGAQHDVARHPGRPQQMPDRERARAPEAQQQTGHQRMPHQAVRPVHLQPIGGRVGHLGHVAAVRLADAEQVEVVQQQGRGIDQHETEPEPGVEHRPDDAVGRPDPLRQWLPAQA